MARFNSRIPQFMREIETKIPIGLANSGRRGVRVARPLTPVDTGYAKKSVHHVVKNHRNMIVGGDTSDGNGNAPPDYPDRNMPTVYVGSNTALRPYQFTGPGGYYLGLELGIYSRKGSTMLATAFSEMIAHIEDDIRRGLR